MVTIKIGGHRKYVALKKKRVEAINKKNARKYGRIYILDDFKKSIHSCHWSDEEKRRKLLLFFNPFDCWASNPFGRLSEQQIRKRLTSKQAKEKYHIYYFDTKEQIEKFIEKNTPVFRKKLLKKYKNSLIGDVPMGDLKDLSVIGGVF